ncbi:MAG: hypothetical protein R3C03_04265 [Pirellulaceae bacterium]
MPKPPKPFRKYGGPTKLVSDVELALQTLSDKLVLRQESCKTHTVLLIENFGARSSLEAAAVYLVSAIAQNIEANLRLREALFDEDHFARDLATDVKRVVGGSKVDDEVKTKERDPWLWEAISHLFVHLSRLNSEFHAMGEVLAKTSIKFDVRDHGLDLIGIYEGAEFGLSAGECKAYLTDPSRGITDAANKLGEVESNARDIEIRAAVNQLRSSIPEAKQKMIAGSFWNNERSYFPFVCCDDEYSTKWTTNRKLMEALEIPVEQKVLVPLAIPKARKKFDRLCALMRIYVAKESE